MMKNDDIRLQHMFNNKEIKFLRTEMGGKLKQIYRRNFKFYTGLPSTTKK